MSLLSQTAGNVLLPAVLFLVAHEAKECVDPSQRLAHMRQHADGHVDDWDLITCSPPKWVHHRQGFGLAPVQGRPRGLSDLKLYVAGGVIPASAPVPTWTPIDPRPRCLQGNTWGLCATRTPSAAPAATRTPVPATPGPARSPTAIPPGVIVVAPPCPAGWELKANGFCYRPMPRHGRMVSIESTPTPSPSPTATPAPTPPSDRLRRGITVTVWEGLIIVIVVAVFAAWTSRRRGVPRGL